MTELVLPSPAKINLFLHITGRRADGYHELQTLFQFLDYGDTMRFRPSDDGIVKLNCNIKALETDDNLVVRAAKLLQQQFAPNKGIEIDLEKILPMGGGVGGGSSNCATTILALNRLWQLNLSSEQMQQIGLTLGADVPVFVNGQAVFAEGVGEIFTPCEPPQQWYLVAKPPCHIATAKIFTDPALPRNSVKIRPDDYRFENTRNDCEALVKKHHIEVAITIRRLLECAPTRLTGTGACVFACFDDKQSAVKAMSCLPDGVSGFVAQGQNVSPTVRALQNSPLKPTFSD